MEVKERTSYFDSQMSILSEYKNWHTSWQSRFWTEPFAGNLEPRLKLGGAKEKRLCFWHWELIRERDPFWREIPSQHRISLRLQTKPLIPLGFLDYSKTCFKLEWTLSEQVKELLARSEGIGINLANNWMKHGKLWEILIKNDKEKRRRSILDEQLLS